ncbi:hypothetical protein QK360_00660 [Pseudomonas aeruginosa]|nr:hypothetical protein [Pseudomonas aeruginosa]MDI3744196.1 hypothetical protein [Pseudomonas aeruginosa]
MSDIRKQAKPRAMSLITIVQWTWLIGLSILLAAGWRTTGAPGNSTSPEANAHPVQAIEARVVALEESNLARQVQAPAATQQALQSLRESLEGRLDQLQQAQAGYALTTDQDALRKQVEQLVERSTTVKAAAPARSRATRLAPRTLKKEEPLSFRVLGAEKRAGLHSLSVVPAEGVPAADAIRVMLPGEAQGQWRLEAIEGNTAVFRSGGQTRRLAIP